MSSIITQHRYMFYGICHALIETKVSPIVYIAEANYLNRMSRYPGIVKLAGKNGIGLITDGSLNTNLLYKYCNQQGNFDK